MHLLVDREAGNHQARLAMSLSLQDSDDRNKEFIEFKTCYYQSKKPFLH